MSQRRGEKKRPKVSLCCSILPISEDIIRQTQYFHYRCDNSFFFLFHDHPRLYMRAHVLSGVTSEEEIWSPSFRLFIDGSCHSMRARSKCSTRALIWFLFSKNGHHFDFPFARSLYHRDLLSLNRILIKKKKKKTVLIVTYEFYDSVSHRIKDIVSRKRVH